MTQTANNYGTVLFELGVEKETVEEMKRIFSLTGYDEANGILKTVMYCAGTPDEEQLAQIKAYLAAKHHRETVELTICTQPELIGGFVLETGDLVEDYSVRGRIKNLEQKLTWR